MEGAPCQADWVRPTTVSTGTRTIPVVQKVDIRHTVLREVGATAVKTALNSAQ